jgi:hypothetical protein
MAAPASAKAAGDKRVWKLPRESELRFEVAADKSFTVVVSSNADILISECNLEHVFEQDNSFAIFASLPVAAACS